MVRNGRGELIEKPGSQADRVSDLIVAIVKAEVEKPGSSTLEILAGQLLALTGYLRTMPPGRAPDTLLLLQDVVRQAVVELTQVIIE